MPRAKRSIEVALTIDGFSLIWNLHREQQWTDDDELRGVAIHVKAAERTRRELHLEYPGVISQQKAGFVRADPGRPTIVASRVAAHIRQALAEGWDPASRGKPFVYEVSEAPN
jgi:hypothetical protein